jgi:hypothetical protein
VVGEALFSPWIKIRIIFVSAAGGWPARSESEVYSHKPGEHTNLTTFLSDENISAPDYFHTEPAS